MGVSSFVEKVVQPFKPHYMWIRKRVLHIVGELGDRLVLIRVKISNGYDGARKKANDAVFSAYLRIHPLASPVSNRVLGLYNGTAANMQSFTVSIRDGIVQFRMAVGGQILRVQEKIANVVGMIGLGGAKQAVSDIVAFAFQSAGRACDKVYLLGSTVRDGIVQFACCVNGKRIDLKITYEDLVRLCQWLYSNMREKVMYVANNVRSIAGTQKAQLTAASAAGGAVALGASGGAAGLVAGGGLGAGCGIVLAPFTFGLSIPVGAALGAGTGLVVGTAAGGTAGLISGGAAGYGVHQHKDGIKNSVSGALSNVKKCKALLTGSTGSTCN